MKLILLMILSSMCMTVFGQYDFENRDIQLSFNLTYEKDTILKVTGSVINKLNNTIYHSGFPLKFNHEKVYFYAYSDDELVIQLGDVSKMIPVEYLLSVEPIESNETLYFEQTITSHFFLTKNRLYLSFDYLNIQKFDKETKNKIGIIPYPGETNILGCPLYSRYCDWFKFEIPYQPPLDTIGYIDKNDETDKFK